MRNTAPALAALLLLTACNGEPQDAPETPAPPPPAEPAPVPDEPETPPEWPVGACPWDPSGPVDC